jgi:hypothetical protein
VLHHVAPFNPRHKETMRTKRKPIQVRINEVLAEQINKYLPAWQKQVGWKVTKQKFCEQAIHDFILKFKEQEELKGKAETETGEYETA